MYINEHILCIRLILCKNYKNEEINDKDVLERLEFEKNIKKLDEMSYGNSKRLKAIQDLFNSLKKQAEYIKPCESDFLDLYKMIVEISKRLVNKYARGRNYDVNEISNITYLRVLKYIKSFDLDKTSKISGTRVNSFAYLTQIIKRVIFTEIHRENKENKLVNVIKETYNVFNDEILDELGTKNTYLVESYDNNIEESILNKNILEAIFSLKDISKSIPDLIKKAYKLYGFEANDVLKIIKNYNLFHLLEKDTEKNRWIIW